MPTLRAGTWNDGLTFIELTIVLLIIGIVTVLVLPRLGTLTGDDLKRAARHLSGVAQFLTDRASTEKRMHRLVYDVAEGVYWAEAPDENGQFPEPLEPPEHAWRLPEDVRFTDVVVPARGKVSDGRVHTQFYPSGRIDRTLVHLARANDERDAMTVEINPVTGRVKVYAEYRDDVAAAVK
jgi:prepilin-type N-terminal cleavage/methylation domain-containing protein